jgi:superfamily II DNA or RNA helicase
MSSLPAFADWLRTSLGRTPNAVPGDPAPGSRSGAYHRRLVGALVQDAAGRQRLGAADFVILLRAALQRELRNGVQAALDVGLDVVQRLGIEDHHWSRASLVALPIRADRVRIIARDWQPAWLPGVRDCPPEGILYDDTPRRTDDAVAADPLVTELVGFSTYNSDAQREAVRTVLTAPPGATVIVNLPTGSGKSLCGILPALRQLPTDPARSGVTPFVVPTVALSLDLERRLRHENDPSYRSAYRPDELEAAALIRSRCESGLQGPVFLSPEALAGSLRHALRVAASRGYLRALVVDEAHMVSAWGDEFRPAFQQIAAIRRELLQSSLDGGHAPFVTILASATLTEARLRHLTDLFGYPGPLHHLHAVRLRPEPSYWIVEAATEEERYDYLLDAIHHFSRPMILYTVKRSQAEAWFKRLWQDGFRRLGMIHGDTRTERRRELLRAWDQDHIDLMVATSAFGLGVDKADVRAVVHAALPEGVDRFYQEVGRGGRDGFGSLSLLIWTRADWKTAKRLMSPTLIGPDRGHERWQAMFNRSVRLQGEGERYRVSLTVPPSQRPGDIDMDNDENQRWNLRTLLLMERAGLLELSWDEARGPRDIESRMPQELVIQLRRPDTLDARRWTASVAPVRDWILEPAALIAKQLRRLLNSRQCIAEVLRESYASRPLEVPVVLACGGCPRCRADGSPSYAGRLRCRHWPEDSWPALPLGSGLQKFLVGDHHGLIFYPATLGSGALPARLAEITQWLLNEGIVYLSAPKELLDACEAWFRAHPSTVVFLGHFPPRGTLARQPAAVVVSDRPDGLTLDEIWPNLQSRNAVTILVLPESSPEPGYPHRRLAEMWTRPKIMLQRWEDLYRE